MQGQIKSMQLLDSDQLCLTCPVTFFLRPQWLGDHKLVPEEMKIPCIEAASSFHGITYLPFLHLWGIHLCSNFMEDSFQILSRATKCDFASQRHAVLIVQRPDKGLVKSRAHRAQKILSEGEMWTPGAALVSLARLEEVQQVFSCFLCTGREILINKTQLWCVKSHLPIFI